MVRSSQVFGVTALSTGLIDILQGHLFPPNPSLHFTHPSPLFLPPQGKFPKVNCPLNGSAVPKFPWPTGPTAMSCL